jgi:hypothetical protein
MGDIIKGVASTLAPQKYTKKTSFFKDKKSKEVTKL